MTMKPNYAATAETESQVAVFESIEDRTMFSTYLVTTTADSGTGSLRAAILAANAHRGLDAIHFDIDSASKTITPLTQLPQLTDAVTIDASTQPGHGKNPVVELSGARSGGYGLVLRGGNSAITGLDINRFSTGILIIGGNHDTITGNFIGTDLTGTHAEPNTDKGIVVQSADNVIGGTGRFGRNLISGNKNNGIQLYTTAAKGNIVAGNYIGTNVDGTGAIANGTGVAITGGVNNVIGGRGASQRNILSGNSADGIVVNSAGTKGNLIVGNYVGTDATGTAALGNGNYGVEISQPSNVVGGARAGQGNVISGNDNSGVALWLSTANHNVVIGNFIGTDYAGKHPIGNAWRGIDVTNGASDNMIGGTRRGAGNLISGNVQSGVQQYQGGGNTFAGNTLGFNVNHTAAMGNGHDGIQLVYALSGMVMNNYIGNNAASAVAHIGGGPVSLVKNTIINDTLYGF